jgi:hypothetical protein
MKQTLMLLAVLSIAACASERDQLIDQGYPVSYADGFADGCHSGKKAGGSYFDEFKKDVPRFEQDTRYAQGWSDGFRQCESEEEAAQRNVRMAIEIQNMQEIHRQNIGEDILNGIDTTGLESLQ